MELFRKTRKKEIKDVNNHHNLEEFVACGEVTGSKLSDAEELIERIRLVLNGMEACNKTIIMYLGDEAVVCYVCQTPKGIVKMTVNKNGSLTFWLDDVPHYKVDLTSFDIVYQAIKEEFLGEHLKRFFLENIQLVKSK